jgi:hypothetical protein
MNWTRKGKAPKDAKEEMIPKDAKEEMIKLTAI